MTTSRSMLYLVTACAWTTAGWAGCASVDQETEPDCGEACDEGADQGARFDKPPFRRTTSGPALVGFETREAFAYSVRSDEGEVSVELFDWETNATYQAQTGIRATGQFVPTGQEAGRYALEIVVERSVDVEVAVGSPEYAFCADDVAYWCDADVSRFCERSTLEEGNPLRYLELDCTQYGGVCEGSICIGVGGPIQFCAGTVAVQLGVSRDRYGLLASDCAASGRSCAAGRCQ